jgi:hypothetical protein
VVTHYGDDDRSQGLTALRTALKNLDKLYEEVNFKYQAALNQVAILPSKEDIKNRRAFISRCLEIRTMENDLRCGFVFDEMSFHDKQNFIRLIFAGHDDYGKKYGVYIRRLEGRPARYHFEAYGRLGNVEGWIGKKMSTQDSLSDIVLRRHEAGLCQNVARLLKKGSSRVF